MKPPEEASALFSGSLPDSLTDEGEPVFAEPWQAQVFAMTITLFEKGLFSWNEWADALSGQRNARVSSGNDQPGNQYYEDWLAALEYLVGSRTEVQRNNLIDLKQRWEQAYRSTPHGEKVVL